MVFFEKSQPAPECLAKEKLKTNGDYKCGDVLPRLRNDFKNKCYLCELGGLTNINVEHFVPHEGDIHLKFDWNNLFWSCSHCNNIKSNIYKNLLDCSKVEAEESLAFKFSPWPYEKVRIENLNEEPATLETKQLLEAVYNGTTLMKKMESASLRDKLLEEVVKFQGDLNDYIRNEFNEEIKELQLLKIKTHLSKSSNFTAFKRDKIRSNPELLQEFEKYFD